MVSWYGEHYCYGQGRMSVYSLRQFGSFLQVCNARLVYTSNRRSQLSKLYRGISRWEGLLSSLVALPRSREDIGFGLRWVTNLIHRSVDCNECSVHFDDPLHRMVRADIRCIASEVSHIDVFGRQYRGFMRASLEKTAPVVTVLNLLIVAGTTHVAYWVSATVNWYDTLSNDNLQSVQILYYLPILDQWHRSDLRPFLWTWNLIGHQLVVSYITFWSLGSSFITPLMDTGLTTNDCYCFNWAATLYTSSNRLVQSSRRLIISCSRVALFIELVAATAPFESWFPHGAYPCETLDEHQRVDSVPGRQTRVRAFERVRRWREAISVSISISKPSMSTNGHLQ